MVNQREYLEKIEIGEGDNKDGDFDISHKEKKNKIRDDVGGPSQSQTVRFLKSLHAIKKLYFQTKYHNH